MIVPTDDFITNAVDKASGRMRVAADLVLNVCQLGMLAD